MDLQGTDGEVERYHLAVEIRLREYNGRAILYGEVAARQWLSEQPPASMEEGEPTP